MWLRYPGGMIPGETPSTLLASTGGALRTTPGLVDPNVLEARAELRRQEDYYANERIKWALGWFFVLWLSSLVIDAVACFGLGLGSFTRALLHRLVPLPWAGIFLYRVRRGPLLGELDVYRGILIFDVFAMVWLASTAVTTGGLKSIFQTVVLFVPLTMIIVPSQLKRSAIAFVVMLLTYLITMIGGVALNAGLRPQLGTSIAWVHFTFYLMAFAGMGSTISVVSHILWSLRREVFESKSIGKYRLRRLLGRGGMGEVWAAYHAGLRRDVALKLLSLREGAATASLRFEREVQAMVKLSHPNTVRVFDFGVAEGGLLYYAMELLEGEHLGRIVRREGPLDPRRVRHLLLQAARALAEAHSLGIVHRDVKPENLLAVDAGGERDFVKVLDFGIATSLENEEAQRLTQTGTVAGTPGTVSPEVIRGEGATPASDVYALGAVGYLLLTGSLPFTGENVSQVMLAHLHDAPLAPSVRRGELIPTGLETIILRCLEKDAANRYPSARELADALAAIDIGAWVPRTRAAGGDDEVTAGSTSSPSDRTRPLPSLRPKRPSGA